MTREDAQAFVQMWASMLEVYDKTVSDAAVAMAFQALIKYDIADIRRAINAHVADPINGRFPAKPADLILHIDGDPESRALQAWTMVESAISLAGPYKTVVFDDPRIMIALEDMGGWIQFCGMSGDELPHKRVEFVRRYKGYVNRPSVRHPPKLIGIAEAQNSMRIQNWQETPYLIGNPEKARLVYESGQQETQKLTTLDSVLERIALQKPTN